MYTVDSLFGRLIVREIAGTITALTALIGGCFCSFFAYRFNKLNSEIAVKFVFLYLTTGLLMFCTIVMGAGGILHFKTYMWDIAYNIRTVAIVLEVIALIRYFQAISRLGLK